MHDFASGGTRCEYGLLQRGGFFADALPSALDVAQLRLRLADAHAQGDAAV